MSRSPSVISLTAALGDFTVRAAFSHVPLFQSALWMVDNMMMKPVPGNMATGTPATTIELPKPQVWLERSVLLCSLFFCVPSDVASPPKLTLVCNFRCGSMACAKQTVCFSGTPIWHLHGHESNS